MYADETEIIYQTNISSLIGKVQLSPVPEGMPKLSFVAYNLPICEIVLRRSDSAKRCHSYLVSVHITRFRHAILLQKDNSLTADEKRSHSFIRSFYQVRDIKHNKNPEENAKITVIWNWLFKWRMEESYGIFEGNFRF